jgi:alkaline phosphatase D
VCDESAMMPAQSQKPFAAGTKIMANNYRSSRRQFLGQSAALGAVLGSTHFSNRASAAILTAESERPRVSHGLQIGDVSIDHAMIWSRADRPSRLVVDWSTRANFRNVERVYGPSVLETSDYCGRLQLVDLPRGREIFVRVFFESLDTRHTLSEPVYGSLSCPDTHRRDVRFVWGGDTAGQGWGIDLDFGGMRIYEAMRRVRPDFFVHNGDNIYADGPMQSEVELPDGSTWRNAYLDLEPAKTAVAETLEQFRGCYRYNLLDANLQRFNAEVPQIWQWDDHEVTNNWSESKDLSGDTRYHEKSVQLLTARAAQAFRDYSPMQPHTPDDAQRVYRRISYGPDIDVFVLDMRSYRGANSYNRQEEPSDATAFLGETQLRWLKHELLASKSTWKCIAADMPIGLVVGDGSDAEGRPRFEAISNGDGPVLGREFEMADLLRFIKKHRINNLVWLTADVHYCAAHYYDPKQAQFADFEPFWEFVAGPLHAGSFGPNALDNTFGPRVVFQKAPPNGQANLSPKSGLQFFGQVDFDHRSRALTIAFKDISGEEIFSQTLTPTAHY